jgi:hypothetical protein
VMSLDISIEISCERINQFGSETGLDSCNGRAIIAHAANDLSRHAFNCDRNTASRRPKRMTRSVGDKLRDNELRPPMLSIADVDRMFREVSDVPPTDILSSATRVGKVPRAPRPAIRQF